MSFTRHLTKGISNPLHAQMLDSIMAALAQTPGAVTGGLGVMKDTAKSVTGYGEGQSPEFDAANPTTGNTLQERTDNRDAAIQQVDREKPQLRTNTITGQQFGTGTPGAKPLSEQDIPGHQPQKNLHASHDQPYNIVMHLTKADYDTVNAQSTAEDVANTAAKQVMKGVLDSGVKIDDDAQKKFFADVVKNSQQWYATMQQSGQSTQLTDYYTYLTQLANSYQLQKEGNLPQYQPDFIKSAVDEKQKYQQDYVDTGQTVKDAVPYDKKTFGNETIWRAYYNWASGQLQGHPDADVSVDAWKKSTGQ